jgi:hypothetical protein
MMKHRAFRTGYGRPGPYRKCRRMDKSWLISICSTLAPASQAHESSTTRVMTRHQELIIVPPLPCVAMKAKSGGSGVQAG